MDEVNRDAGASRGGDGQDRPPISASGAAATGPVVNPREVPMARPPERTGAHSAARADPTWCRAALGLRVSLQNPVTKRLRGCLSTRCEHRDGPELGVVPRVPWHAAEGSRREQRER